MLLWKCAKPAQMSTGVMAHHSGIQGCAGGLDLLLLFRFLPLPRSVQTVLASIG